MKDYLAVEKGWFSPYLFGSARRPIIPRNMKPDVIFCHGPFLAGRYHFTIRFPRQNDHISIQGTIGLVKPWLPSPPLSSPCVMNQHRPRQLRVTWTTRLTNPSPQNRERQNCHHPHFPMSSFDRVRRLHSPRWRLFLTHRNRGGWSSSFWGWSHTGSCGISASARRRVSSTTFSSMDARLLWSQWKLVHPCWHGTH